MNEPIRIVADWLNDPTGGVNAVLAGLTVDVGDTAPMDILVKSVLDDEDVAVGRAPTLTTGQGAISVSHGGTDDLRPDSAGINLDARCTILIRYDGRHHSGIEAQKAAGYVIRAAYRCLNAMWAQDLERNGLQLLGPNAMTITAVQPRTDTDPVMAGILLQCEFRDSGN